LSSPPPPPLPTLTTTFVHAHTLLLLSPSPSPPLLPTIIRARHLSDVGDLNLNLALLDRIPGDDGYEYPKVHHEEDLDETVGGDTAAKCSIGGVRRKRRSEKEE